MYSGVMEEQATQKWVLKTTSNTKKLKTKLPPKLGAIVWKGHALVWIHS